MHYLRHGSEVGYLNQGGSFVTFLDQSSNDFTIVIETMVSGVRQYCQGGGGGGVGVQH